MDLDDLRKKLSTYLEDFNKQQPFPNPERPLALVVGSEDRGISRLVGEACDLTVSIPMAGRTASLNAATALAVGLFGYALRPEG